MQIYQVDRGEALTVDVTLNDSLIAPVTGYDGSQALTAEVWPGGDAAVLCSPAAAWVTPPAAVAFTLSPAQSQALDPGLYQARVRLDDAGTDVTVYKCQIEVVESPGPAGAATPVYVGYKKLLELAPWVASCFDPARHLTGFLAERATARQTFDQLCLKAYRSPSIGVFGSHSASALAWGGGGMRRTPLPSQLLAQYLAQNLLLVTPQVEKINAYLAVAEIGRQQIGIQNTFAAHGQAFADWASAEISACTAQIDLNGDGVGEIPIPLGVTNPLFT